LSYEEKQEISVKFGCLTKSIDIVFSACSITADHASQVKSLNANQVSVRVAQKLEQKD